MEIIVNDDKFTTSEDACLLDVMVSIQKSRLEGIAVAVNGDVIPRDKWDEKKLFTGDEILLITASQGG